MSTTASEAARKPQSPFVPRPAKILAIDPFTVKEKRFKVVMSDGQPLDYLPMQFVEVSIFGVGEAPISVCSEPSPDGAFEMCIRNVGAVTSAIHQLKAGDTFGIRGPFGNGFDLSQHKGKSFLFVAGGLGLAPARSAIQHVLKERKDFGDITVLCGARTPNDLLFKSDLDEWQRRDDCQCLVTVDRPDAGWKGHSGVITTLFPKISVDPANTVAVIIGPPVMFKFACLEALAAGVREDQIICSLERRMKCGIGKCGHCQINDVYVCQSGPVFTYQQVRRMKEGM